MTQEQLRDLLRQDVVAAAPALLGSTLVYGPMRARIVETEAYRGEDDPACHAYRKSSMKNMVLFGEPGHAYIYLNYGVHWMLNISAHRSGDAAGILVRAAEPIEGIEQMRINRPGVADEELLNGPGKLCKGFGITQAVNGVDLLDLAGELHIEAAPEPVAKVITGPRIGLATGKWHDVPWRFIEADRLRWVSRPRPSVS
ncbi:DNA-3-methyladenine glycosylase [Fimbriimonas ginsengisoli]|uniref:Putative 3-methyladenine DNA glycosylase n=1 Tax=Fimbriimonas ginsengisoli Gsoil 348 TaxID=661478 RepID=A0A068NP56_FIMGI|nr:DNA-3-methyladenine glycosylase [Fimbriimonas ginsengisoli]AIE85147.1 3-methyladenine DNA glycosylase [Fimbriimonas ginsengisoli Gsoil 348]